ncbi:hypothetical protein, partial [Burkholderia cenocepacia]
SSSMIGLAISSVSVVPMPEVNSSPRKLTAPPGLFETVSKRLGHADTVTPSLRDPAGLAGSPGLVVGQRHTRLNKGTSTMTRFSDAPIIGQSRQA